MTTVPHKWTHGDEVTSARLNGLITAMDEIYAVRRDYPFLIATPYASTGETFTLYKQRRYLHFGSTGTLEDPTGVEDDITLSEDADIGRGTLDLESVDWLAPGAMFYVNGCSWCWLDDEP